MRRFRLLAAAAGVALGSLWSAGPARAFAPPPVKHVFIIILENKNYDETFGPTSPASYLSRTLPAQGVLLRQYFGTGHLSNDNYIAMVSGQAPNPQNQADCLNFTDFVAVLPLLDPANGQAVGNGCVFPTFVPTVADQLAAKGLSWKGYMQDMGNDAGREASTCGHPALNGSDGTQNATPTDGYAARHNPFVYFHTLIDNQASCDAHVVRLESLSSDLASAATTPSYSFITPSLCDDGHDAPCKDGRPGGLVSIDAFLQTWVPRITSSAAFKQDGLLLITFDEAEADPRGGATPDASACCGELPGPNSPLPGIGGLGGGRIGAVALSPFIAPGTTSDTPYNHYSMLRSVEDLFGLDHLGYAAASGLAPFGADVYNGSAAASGSGSGSDGSGSGSGAGAGVGAGRSGRLPATGSWPWAPLAFALLAAAVVPRRPGRAARR